MKLARRGGWKRHGTDIPATTNEKPDDGPRVCFQLVGLLESASVSLYHVM